MAGESHTTINHQEIKQWIEERGGKPVHVKNTGDAKDPGILRIEFPDEDLEDISWDDFFQKFDESNLAFLYQDNLKDGRESRFHKFINR